MATTQPTLIQHDVQVRYRIVTRCAGETIGTVYAFNNLEADAWAETFARHVVRTCEAIQDESEADALARALVVGVSSLKELCDQPNYRPTLRADQGAQTIALADAYDAEMERRGDPRRAYRGLGA